MKRERKEGRERETETKRERDKVKIDVVGSFSLLPLIGVPPGCVRMKADGRLKRRVSAARDEKETT